MSHNRRSIIQKERQENGTQRSRKFKLSAVTAGAIQRESSKFGHEITGSEALCVASDLGTKGYAALGRFFWIAPGNN